eukprot:s357_g42.t1
MGLLPPMTTLRPFGQVSPKPKGNGTRGSFDKNDIGCPVVTKKQKPLLVEHVSKKVESSHYGVQFDQAYGMVVPLQPSLQNLRIYLAAKHEDFAFRREEHSAYGGSTAPLQINTIR